MEILFMFLGGLGLFLFGIKSMSDGLQAIAGDKMRIILEKGTKTPLRGVLTGILVTGLIQSSSGTTVLAVGLVNSGLLPLKQAIGVIMGANIGTTVTAYLIGFKLSDYSLPIIAFGVFLLFFFKQKRVTYLGQVLLGFGLLFYGMDIMGDGLKPLSESEFFVGLMANVEDNALLGVLIGTVFTAVVQSSSATIGILQELANQGVVTYLQAVPILFGDNIGTTITALLAGIGATVAAKRAALTHFIFNMVGTLIFLPLFLLGIFPILVQVITDILSGSSGAFMALNPKMQIAQTHGVFNVLNTLIQLPFAGFLATLATKLIPDKGDPGFELAKPKYLEPRLLNNLPVALANASRETLHMGNLAGKSLDYAVSYFYGHDKEDRKQANLLEDAVDALEQEITHYVVQATHNKEIDQELSKRSYMILQVVGDLERVGDHAENLVELADHAIENKIVLSKDALDNLKAMIDQVKDTYQESLRALQEDNQELARAVVSSDDIIDKMELELRKAHILRLNEGKCGGGAGAIYLDILSNLERIGDHSVNIARFVLGEW